MASLFLTTDMAGIVADLHREPRTSGIYTLYTLRVVLIVGYNVDIGMHLISL